MCSMLFRKSRGAGFATPQREIDLVRERMKRAEELHPQRVVK